METFCKSLKKNCRTFRHKNKHFVIQTGTIKHSYLKRLLLVPKNISYHYEHHLYPGIPCYHLPRLHNQLLKHEAVKANYYVSRSYNDVFKNCISKNQHNLN